VVDHPQSSGPFIYRKPSPASDPPKSGPFTRPGEKLLGDPGHHPQPGHVESVRAQTPAPSWSAVEFRLLRPYVWGFLGRSAAGPTVSALWGNPGPPPSESGAVIADCGGRGFRRSSDRTDSANAHLSDGTRPTTTWIAASGTLELNRRLSSMTRRTRAGHDWPSGGSPRADH